MANNSWVQDRERLERELRNEPYQSLLQSLQGQHPFYRQFNSWDEVIASVRAGSAKDSRTDEILEPIFGACGDDRDPRWRSILLAIFWPVLMRIHHFKRHWDPDLESLWANTTWAFLQTIDAIDLQVRPDHLGQKIFNDTLRHLRNVYRREWRWVKRTEISDTEEAQEQDGLDSLVGGQEAIEVADVDRRHDLEVEIKRLRGYVSRGVITEFDLFVIIGTRIYGASLAEFANDQGLDYERTKKRRQRAEATIRRLERKRKTPCVFCPRRRNKPPFYG